MLSFDYMAVLCFARLKPEHSKLYFTIALLYTCMVISQILISSKLDLRTNF